MARRIEEAARRRTVVFTMKRPTSIAAALRLPCSRSFTITIGKRRFAKKFEMRALARIGHHDVPALGDRLEHVVVGLVVEPEDAAVHALPGIVVGSQLASLAAGCAGRRRRLATESSLDNARTSAPAATAAFASAALLIRSWRRSVRGIVDQLADQAARESPPTR